MRGGRAIATRVGELEGAGAGGGARWDLNRGYRPYVLGRMRDTDAAAVRVRPPADARAVLRAADPPSPPPWRPAPHSGFSCNRWSTHTSPVQLLLPGIFLPLLLPFLSPTLHACQRLDTQTKRQKLTRF